MRIRKIGVGSAAKIYGLGYAAFGLLSGVILALASAVGGFATAADGQSSGALSALTGLGAVIALPLLYAVVGVIFGALGALIYNLLAGAIGGLEVELEGEPTYAASAPREP